MRPRLLTLSRPAARPAGIALAAALLTAFLLLIAPTTASAHDALVSSDPAADSELETLPEAVTLTFSAALITGDGSTVVEVQGPDGASVSDGDAEVDGALVTQPLDAAGAPAGEYRVIWRVVSSDGHPTSGEYAFTVTTGADAASDSPAATDDTDAADDADATASDDDDDAPAAGTGDQGDAPATPDGIPTTALPTPLVWIVSIVGILVVVAVVVRVLSLRRRDDEDPDSDIPMGR